MLYHLFYPEIPIYKYVGHASDRAWYEIDAKPVKYPTGSNQTEPRTSTYQQLAASANLTQAPNYSLNYWCAPFLVQNKLVLELVGL